MLYGKVSLKGREKAGMVGDQGGEAEGGAGTAEEEDGEIQGKVFVQQDD